MRRKTKRNKKRLMIGEKIIGLGFFTVLFMGSFIRWAGVEDTINWSDCRNGITGSGKNRSEDGGIRKCVVFV